MKVAYVVGSSGGGTIRHVRMLASGLASRGMTVSMFGPAGSAPAASGHPAGSAPAASGHPPVAFAPVEIGVRPGLRELAAVWRLRALIARSRPDIVHAHGLRAAAAAVLARGRGSGAPRLVVTVHNAPPPGGAARRVYRALELITVRQADAVLCVSGDLEARLAALGARCFGRAVVPAPEPDGTDVSAQARARIRTELGLCDDQPLVLGVGRLAAQKGFGTLLSAAGRWQGRDPRPLLVIAGDGPLAGRLARLAARAGAQARFLGQRGDVPGLLAAADVVVVPSTWEGQPLIVQEAMRAGRPLVACRVGGIPALTGEDAALLIPPHDEQALSAAVLAVLDDPALAARLSAAARARAETLPAERDALDAVAALYARVLSRPR